MNVIHDGHRIIGSAVVLSELDDIRNAKKRDAIEEFYFDTVDGNVELTEQGLARAMFLEAAGLGTTDALHLAAAEAAGVDVLLTTDVDFIRICKQKNLSDVKVINPLIFLSGGI